ncbi:MAG TPA: general secretion pathway protein GspN [Polaromonas sp.]|uniref:type II secretion system protein N n=1 Tax=Polaromonas sp. UBA4122 TaxID=1947074 RepID=UPI000EE53DF5|nr:type II secretion system protein N [Polaromonas sp. UBA4122]HAL40099.1 general secretion pathway protein GspN [Polaromonas sp.]
MKPTPLSFSRPFGRSSSRPSVQPALRFAAWAWCGALVGALLALALFAPARWLADAVAGSTRQQLLLTEPRGTVWQGSARLVLTGGADSQDIAALPGRVQWTLRPSLTGLRFSLLAECCTPEALQLRATPRLGGLRLELADAQSQWPADVLAGLGTPWNTLQPMGQLRLQSHGLNAEWNAGRLLVAGSAVLEARNISSRLSTLRPMGSYRLTLQGGPSISLTLETLEGSLQLTGSGQWVGSRLRFSGEASAAPEREAALANLLNIIGRRNGPRSIITIG